MTNLKCVGLQFEESMSGTVTRDLPGGTFSISDGTFNLFSPEPKTGVRQMVYSFGFRDADDHVSCLKGEKYHARN